MLLKYLKEQESIRLMLLLRKHLWTLIFLAVVMTAGKVARADMFGFTNYNPYTKEERNSSLKEVPLYLKNYRADMRSNLMMLIRYAKQQNHDFKILVHEGQDLLNKSLWEYSREGYNRARKFIDAEDDYFLFHQDYLDKEPKRGTLAYQYLNSIDAVVLNNLYCGKGEVSKIAKKHGLDLISIEYCADEEALNEAYVGAYVDNRSIYAFTDLQKAFKTIDRYESINDSSKNIYDIKEAQNILIINDDSLYDTQEKMVDDLSKTNYDIIVIKPLFAYKERFSLANLNKLHFKKNGSKRLLIAEFNVSEASPKEYYWQNDWKIGSPDWLVRRSFSSKDGIITKFWRLEWKKIISRYFRDVLNEGFDGVLFTGVENYDYFEQQNPLE